MELLATKAALCETREMAAARAERPVNERISDEGSLKKTERGKRAEINKRIEESARRTPATGRLLKQFYVYLCRCCEVQKQGSNMRSQSHLGS
jgi:hypothetical protein